MPTWRNGVATISSWRRPQLAELRDVQGLLLASPVAIMKPERVSMVEGTLGPGGVHKTVMKILLDLLDHHFGISFSFVHEQTGTLGVLGNYVVVTGPERRFDIMAQ
jgi:hypothetical protein